ncbi:hypothetical protein VP01_13239g1, partial [Puccinia sorghi]
VRTILFLSIISLKKKKKKKKINCGRHYGQKSLRFWSGGEGGVASGDIQIWGSSPPPKSKMGYGVPDQHMVDTLEEIPRVRSRPTGTKIRPRDYPGVRFRVEGVDRFLNWYEEAAEVEGANGGNMVCQIGNFIPNEEDLRDMEEMDGYEERDWPKLRAEIQEKWGMRRKRFREGNLE